jgi:hypothetical protein
MNKHDALGALLVSAMLLRAALPAHAGSLSEQLRDSSWQLVSLTDKLPKGNEVQVLSHQEQDWIEFDDRDGQFITGTDALSPGDHPSEVDFGTYSLDEEANTITFYVAGTSSPSWMATETAKFQIRQIKCDQMTLVNPAGATLLWQRNDCPVGSDTLAATAK